MQNDVDRYQDLKNTIDKSKTELTRLQIEDQNLDKEIAVIEKELKEKFKVSPEQIEEYKTKSEENLKKVEKEINEIYEKVK